jgi:hypothetical protein
MIANFIVGMPRSGTTLLTALLDGHPQVLVLNETHAFKWIGAADPVVGLFRVPFYRDAFPEGGSERRELEAALRRRVSGPVDIGTGLTALAESLREISPAAANARLWIEKTPRHYLRARELVEAFGETTRIVFMLRDPRDVVASHAAKWGRSLQRVARHWAEADALAQRYHARWPAAVCTLRYEDLVREPEATTRQVASHFGIEWSEDLMVPTMRGADWRGNSSYEQPIVGISDRSIGQYEKELDARAIAQVEGLLGPRMTRRGYEPTRRPGRLPPAGRLWIELRCALQLS